MLTSFEGLYVVFDHLNSIRKSKMVGTQDSEYSKNILTVEIRLLV